MRKLVTTRKFEKAYQRYVRMFPQSQMAIDKIFLEMQRDIYSVRLESHKLSGRLMGALACSCGYDCRIIFSIRRNEITGEEKIILHNIGTHKQVY